MVRLATRYIENLHTNLDLNARSEHHPAQKKVLLTTLIQCAQTVCAADSLNVQIQHLKKTFRTNEYSNQDIRQSLHHRKRSQSLQEKPISMAMLPYQ
jgi:hypothetical protein